MTNFIIFILGAGLGAFTGYKICKGKGNKTSQPTKGTSQPTKGPSQPTKGPSQGGGGGGEQEVSPGGPREPRDKTSRNATFEQAK